MSKIDLRVAGPWTQEQIDTLCGRLAAKYDSQAVFNVIHDETLIGGFIAKVNGNVLDNSIKSKLNGLRNSLISEG